MDRTKRTTAFAMPTPFANRNSSLTTPRCAHPSHRPIPQCAVNAARMSFDDGLSALQAAGYGSGRLPGTVYLLGAGPGDISLLTERSRAILERADVILYDRLAGCDALSLARPDATLVYVGKRAGYHTRTQDEICALLAAFAGAHDIVVRLKGGDPGVYGRGGEEAAYLRSRGVDVVIVPGITAGSAVAAELGFPLTHRGIADSLRFVTGHARSQAAPIVSYEKGTTLVLYMALATLPTTLKELRKQGLRDDTPAVAVENATLKCQKVAWGTVATLPENVLRLQLKSPTLVVVGDVVALAPGWQKEVRPNVQLNTQSVDMVLQTLRGEDRELLLRSIKK